jgi:putative hydrolase of the HAD superfamily
MKDNNLLKDKRMLDPNAVETWIFDLDNTLYPAGSNIFARVSKRITVYVQDRFSLDEEAARALQKDLFRRHGTTLRGLMVEHGVDGEEYLHFVHDIDVSDIDPNHALAEAIGRLPGRKIIYTNGSVPHARRIMGRIGVEHHFEDVFDIVAAEYVPKPNPDPYDILVSRHGIDPGRAVMVEDMARNLEPAAALGMTTVWLSGTLDWAKEGAEEAYVHHVAEDLTEWLNGLSGASAD